MMRFVIRLIMITINYYFVDIDKFCKLSLYCIDLVQVVVEMFDAISLSRAS